ncbi:MAG: sigma-54 dependent transcriptional regulator [Pirellulales bacterium]|nr:sigma-54 dependent transcriptional regulator [Pirellulales bacterium]
MLGRNPRMRRISQHIERAADVQCTVLITGETGTGKEVLARLLHEVGSRNSAPFVPVNCAALTTTLAESQLFGHEKGAFTGAAGSSLGVFRAASSGVVFLDEVGEMPLELQPKLLRVLQEQEVTPVGSSIPVSINVQIVAATNRNLEAEVAAGRFREDLYYRLNMVELRVPPLRERSEDIPDFVDFFSEKFALRYQRPVWIPTPAILQEFCAYHWPGNIRQLAHVIEQAYVLETEPMLPGRDSATTGEESGPAGRLPYLNLEKLRYEAVRQALVLTRGHKGQAAQMLGVHANTLTRMIAEFKMSPKHWQATVPN